MKFDVFPIRRHGRLIPKLQWWTNQVRGELFLDENVDPEVGRSVRIARLYGPGIGTELIEPLYDAVLVAAKPDWWTMTGWNRVTHHNNVDPTAYQQSWVLVPADITDRDRADAAEASRLHREFPDELPPPPGKKRVFK